MKKLLYIVILVLAVFAAIFLVRRGESNATNNDVLVAYFSATGNTKSVAEKLSNVIGADLFEIIPEQVYTADDLNWHDDKSRSSVEMADKNSRPKIASNVKDMSKYKVVFVGFPIWWGREPSIIDTFLTSYDFNGKTIIPFATSGSSSIGDSGKNLQALAPNAKVLPGKRFATDVSAEDLKSWAETQMQ